MFLVNLLWVLLMPSLLSVDWVMVLHVWLFQKNDREESRLT